MSSSSPPPVRTPPKRKHGASASCSLGGASASNGDSLPRVSRVRFSHVTVREMGLEIWGGGGVPADDGPPLGLSWNRAAPDQHFDIDPYEADRQHSRTPKDSYCMEGCVDPDRRRQMLLGSGSTPKQIKAACKAVTQLNADRWKASEVIFGDLWLFRVPVRADPAELLAMLGQPDGRGYELTVSNWSSAADLARELAAPLNITAHQLLVPVEPNPNLPSLVETSDQDSLDSLASSGEGRTTRSSTSETIDWTVASRAMQACMEQVVLIIRVGSSAGMARGGISSHQQQVHTRETSSEVSLSDALLSRLVGCVANSHIAAQVLHSRRGNVSVVLRGWGDDKIEAEWAEDDPDEFSISPLH